MRVTAEETKARAIQELQTARQKALEAGARSSSDTAGIIFLGQWSPRDGVAHLNGWDNR